jgi:alkanesulfonate monooxygenase SsuD/methylene tetrahydromethanopterin reductase-like flavin-dependent oxidoreductase (luciferase family)
VPYEESQARFFEALEIILQAWKGEPFSYQGQFYRFTDVTVTPRPYRQPHPLVRMAATTAETFPRVGRMGLPIFVGLRGMDIPELAGCLKTYREAWREAGHPGDGDACLRIPIYAAPTEQAAREEPYETITYYMERQANLTLEPLGRAGTGPTELREGQAQRLSTLSYDDILSRKVAFGTSTSLVDRLGRLRDELGITGIAAELNPGGLLPFAREMRSLEILTQQVMPALR